MGILLYFTQKDEIIPDGEERLDFQRPKKYETILELVF